jgi:hypothetical protein
MGSAFLLHDDQQALSNSRFDKVISDHGAVVMEFWVIFVIETSIKIQKIQIFKVIWFHTNVLQYVLLNDICHTCKHWILSNKDQCTMIERSIECYHIV